MIAAISELAGNLWAAAIVGGIVYGLTPARRSR